ncbi:MAG TPA: hypothetical protein VF620_09830 [Allosphingosinicella sp.]|jgi:hypothetical protein
MTFGFASLTDLLSWTIAVLLGLEAAATIVLLRRDRRTWFETPSGTFLWWSSKVTPLLAVPCMILVALLAHRLADAWAYGALTVFVLIAVPLGVWNRFGRRRRSP